jgi:hypothetical protein
MKVQYFILKILILTLFYACQNPKSANSVDSAQGAQNAIDSIAEENTKQEITAISWTELKNDAYGNILNPVTIADFTKVYEHPDSTSKVLKILPFNTDLNVLRKGEIMTENLIEGVKSEDFVPTTFHESYYFFWYEVLLGTKKAYVKHTDMVIHSMTCKNGDKILIQSEYSFPTKILKYSLLQNKITNILHIKRDEHYTIVKPIPHNGWKNVNALFNMTEIRAYCGGGSSTLYIVDANERLDSLTETRYWDAEDYGDGSESQSETVFLPIKTANGKVVLAAAGDTVLSPHIRPEYYDAPPIYPYPKNINIAKEELIIHQTQIEKAVLDKNKKPIKRNKNEYKTAKTIKTVFYQWNGYNLMPFKTF